MSEPWTDERIREAFIYDGGESEYHDPINGAQTQRKIAGDIFDSWLSEHDRQVAERAWDEATARERDDSGCVCFSPEHRSQYPAMHWRNPYRAAKGEQK